MPTSSCLDHAADHSHQTRWLSTLYRLGQLVPESELLTYTTGPAPRAHRASEVDHAKQNSPTSCHG